jgi:hypothetical protein
MAVLKSLTFTNVPARTHDPVASRRAKLVERLEEQKKLFQNPSHVRTVQRWTGIGRCEACRPAGPAAYAGRAVD